MQHLNEELRNICSLTWELWQKLDGSPETPRATCIGVPDELAAELGDKVVDLALAVEREDFSLHAAIEVESSPIHRITYWAPKTQYAQRRSGRRFPPIQPESARQLSADQVRFARLVLKKAVK